MSVFRIILLVSLLTTSMMGQAEDVGTAFTYQGELNQSGAPANGTFDLEFGLFNAATDGAPVAEKIVFEEFVVANGVFTVNLDFGSIPFGDEKLWLEIAVRDWSSDADFSPMSPRQVITPTPFALRAQSAADADTSCNLGVCTGPGRATLTCGNMVAVISCEVPGTNWTARTAAEDNQWRGVTYGDGLFAAVSLDGQNRVMTSPDGINWTAHSAPANLWLGVTYGGGMYVAVGHIFMSSPDGINWTSDNVGVHGTLWQSITYGDGLFVAVANTGDNRVATSPDGINWTFRSAAENNGWSSVTYGDGLFVAVANLSDRVMISPDGINWTAHTASDTNPWGSIAYGDGLFVATSYLGPNHVMTSPDGINWTNRVAASSSYWRSITYNGGLFVAVANGGTDRVMTSPDGINWTGHNVPESQWMSVTSGGGRVVAVGIDGTKRVMTSP